MLSLPRQTRERKRYRDIQMLIPSQNTIQGHVVLQKQAKLNEKEIQKYFKSAEYKNDIKRQ